MLVYCVVVELYDNINIIEVNYIILRKGETHSPFV